MIPALLQARDQTHPGLIRRTRHDMTYRGNWLWVYDFIKGFEEIIFRSVTRRAGVRKYTDSKGATMSYVLGRELYESSIRRVHRGWLWEQWYRLRGYVEATITV